MKTSMVLIYLDGKEVKVAPDGLKVQVNDMVRFHCEEYRYEVDFNKDNSPFHDKHLEHPGGDPPKHSRVDKDPPKGATIQCHYRVRLFDDKGTKIGEKDPVIIVVPYPVEDEKRETEEFDVEEAGDTLQDVVKKILQSIRDATSGDPKPRFFPNGIELIDVDVSLGAAKGVEAKLKIAGEKGIHTLNSQGSE